ncbi:MAG TPA: glutamine synthetase [Candidatus Nanoarchaeia archaeon]|nr:glutamine synthetase [Candidatus Nanoarchaeia archaeon]
MKIIAEYIWLDGINKQKGKLWQEPRSKAQVFNVDMSSLKPQLNDMPIWGFDGSSTEQAEGHFSDCVLAPVRVYSNPLRPSSDPKTLSVMVLSEVYLPPKNGAEIIEPHPSNTRANLVNLVEKYQAKEQFWFGLEQEYTFMRVDEKDPSRITRPLGFPKGKGFPVEQGKYYCGSGADKILGRQIVEEHLQACLEANVLIAGINAEVMPGQWEYQIGNGTSESDPLRVADDLIVARYLMDRIAEKHGVVASLEPKPHPKWNGAGAHTNFSNVAMRLSDACFPEILRKLEKHHTEHIAVYGPGIEKRLTGLHETSSCDKFSYGVSDRGASVRIPWQVAVKGKGYMEDRRPCANMDPYVVEAKLIETIMEG